MQSDQGSGKKYCGSRMVYIPDPTIEGIKFSLKYEIFWLHIRKIFHYTQSDQGS
jgi:hypothetical protein